MVEGMRRAHTGNNMMAVNEVTVARKSLLLSSERVALSRLRVVYWVTSREKRPLLNDEERRVAIA